MKLKIRIQSSILLTVAFSLFTATSSFAALWTSGHGDLGIGYDAGLDEWEPHFAFHEEEGEEEGGEHAIINGAEPTKEEYEIGELTLRVLGPEQPSAGIVDSGATSVYLLPQDESDAELLGNPYVGFVAEEVPTGVFVSDTITISLIGVSGPGVFSLWSTGLFGPDPALMSSAPGSSAPDSFDLVAMGGHSHFNIGFSEIGDYDVTYRVEGVLVAGGATTGQDFTVNYRVLPEPSSASLAALGAVMLLTARRRK